MEVYKNADMAAEAMYMDEGMTSLRKAMAEMGVKGFGRGGLFERIESRNVDKDEYKVCENDAVKCMECVKSAYEGLKRIDLLIEELEDSRGNLVHSFLKLRNAYRTPEKRMEIKMIAEADKYKDPEMAMNVRRQCFASILGYEELPDNIVNLDFDTCLGDAALRITFGVRDSPTSVMVLIPFELDLGERHFPDGDEMSSVETARIGNLSKVDIELYVFTGTLPECGDYAINQMSNIVAKCRSIEDLRDKVKTAMKVDARKVIKNVGSISEVKSVDDFVAWRATRAVNAAVKLNSGDGK